jgi:hypothetical protein
LSFVGTGHHSQFVTKIKLDQLFDTKSIGELHLGDFLLHSISVTTMNYSFNASDTFILWSIAHISQVILSFILIILSIGSYIGLESDLHSRDEDFYLRVHTKKKNISE